MNTPIPNQNPVPNPNQVPGVEQTGITQEGQRTTSVGPEVAPVAPEVKPELAPEPSVEQVGAVPSSPPPVQPTQIQDQPVPVQSQPQDPAVIDDQIQAGNKAEEGFEKPGEIEKKYVKKADETIDRLEDKPFEEEEAHEDLQIGYLKERFDKVLKKSEHK